MIASWTHGEEAAGIVGRSRSASLLFLLLCAIPSFAWGEGFVDLYGGAALTRDANVTVKEFSPFLPTVAVRRNVSFETSTTFGGRFGFWIEPLPWLGFALDVSSFRAVGDGVALEVYPHLSPVDAPLASVHE